MEDRKFYTLLIYTEHTAGVLSQVTAVFTRRQVNIESINASSSSINGVHKYTITAWSTEDQIIKINDTNVCEIKDGCVRMSWADCPDQLCIHQRAIDENGGMIVCLPNRIVIEGEKGGEVRYDEEKDSVLDAVT